jgi:hypothetical protein
VAPIEAATNTVTIPVARPKMAPAASVNNEPGTIATVAAA